MLNLNAKLLGGAAVALLATTFAAQAQTVPLYSGGGTLAEKVYRDIFNCYGNTSGGDTTVGLAGAATGCNAATAYRSNVEPLYVGVGSGNGKKGFVNHDASHFTDGPKAPDAVPVPSTADFGPFYGTGTGAGWVRDTTDSGPFPTKVSFVGSDDPLTAADITTYNANLNNWGAPIQVPALITTVAIPFNGTFNEKGKDLHTSGGTSKVQFSTNSFCGVYTGAIANWNDAALTADNANQALIANLPIKLVFRSDGSGTTFLFSNALIHQCGTQSTPRAGVTHPVPDQWMTDNGLNPVAADADHLPASNNNFFINVNTAGHMPAGSIGANGSGGVKAAITGNVGSVGYISPDFIVNVDPTGPKAVNLQSWLSFSTNLAPKWIAAGPKSGTAIMGAVKSPLFTAASCPVGTGVGQASDGICAHNPLNWGATNPTPISSSAFPVGGFTFVDMYTCYASATDKDAIAGTTALSLGLWRWFFGSTTENASIVKTQLTNNGFSLVPGSWISSAKKLLTTDAKTKISTPGTAKTGCATVSGSGA
jgi:ABC-type phosphate transport system substrate-binding protein